MSDPALRQKPYRRKDGVPIWMLFLFMTRNVLGPKKKTETLQTLSMIIEGGKNVFWEAHILPFVLNISYISLDSLYNNWYGATPHLWALYINLQRN